MTPLEMARVDRSKMDRDKYLMPGRKVKSVRGYYENHRNTTTINTNYESLSKPGISKKVFIGGHDLEKAA